ncbi:hypothetical protein BDW22DRAFT_440469 [Trametopsis cervina]|nr:hypothetical protein BDW22DRAFT_440469 [Trametopsis cervina]
MLWPACCSGAPPWPPLELSLQASYLAHCHPRWYDSCRRSGHRHDSEPQTPTTSPPHRDIQLHHDHPHLAPQTHTHHGSQPFSHLLPSGLMTAGHRMHEWATTQAPRPPTRAPAPSSRIRLVEETSNPDDDAAASPREDIESRR